MVPQFNFERYFPALEQPWYFSEVSDIEAAIDGTIYVADSSRGKVSRFSKDGLLITQWGRLGPEEGEFTFDKLKLAIDQDGRIYVATDSRLQVFGKNGAFISVHYKSDDILDLATDGFKHLYLLFADRVDVIPIGQLTALPQSINLSRPPGSIAATAYGRVYVSQRSASSTDDYDEILAYDPSPNGYELTLPTIVEVGLDADDLSIDKSSLLYAVGDANGSIRAYDDSGVRQVLNDVSAIGGPGLKAITFGDQNRSYISKGAGVFGVEGDTDTRSFAWQSSSDEPARFNRPLDVSRDGADRIYVVEASTSRVQKFSRQGIYLQSWDLQQAIAYPDTAKVYIHATASSPYKVLVSTGDTLETYKANGDLITPDPFESLNLVAPGPMDGTPSGRLLLSDTDGAGTKFFVVTTSGKKEQEFRVDDCRVSDLTVGVNNLLYLLCEGGPSGPQIQVYTLRGDSITTVSLDSDPENPGDPRSITSDSVGRVFLLTNEVTITPGVGLTSFESTIRVFRSDLKEIGVFRSDLEGIGVLGSSGYSAGRFNFDGQVAVAGIDVGSQNELIIAEPGNNRIQILTEGGKSKNNKAIIVAGGGDYPENFLWTATQINTNNAYDKLIYQGFTADRILYLHPDLNLDLDGNPDTKEIDGLPSIENLAMAFGAAATAKTEHGCTQCMDFAVDADNLVIYFADHGDKGIFRVNPEEVIKSSQVSDWLDNLQDNRWPGRDTGAPLGKNGWLTFIYEACESGTFINELAPVTPGIQTNKRLVITTSSSDENASFIAQGLLSFSYQFWINIFNGSDLLDAFEQASATIADTYPHQTPIFKLIFEGNEVGGAGLDAFFVAGANFGFAARTIGNATSNVFAGPDIVNPSVELLTSNTAFINVESVDDQDGVSRVWAIIEPPNYLVRDADNPILELPTVDLEISSNCGPGIEFCASGIFADFTTTGDYRITILAQDIFGNLSRVSIMNDLSVNNPLKNKAVLLVAGSSDPGDARGNTLLDLGDFAYRALLKQDYVNDLDPSTGFMPEDDEIRYFTQGTAGIYAGADSADPSSAQLDALIGSNLFVAEDPASSDLQHFVLVIMADYGGPLVDGFEFPGLQPLLIPDLLSFLAKVESVVNGKLVVVLEGSNAGAVVDRLAAGSNKRIIISSTSPNEIANVATRGGISFSKYFWNSIRDGFSLGIAWDLATNAITAGASGQHPLIDANGNGIANEPADGIQSRLVALGPGIVRGGNGPLVGAAPDIEINDLLQTSAVILAKNVSATSALAEVTGWVRIKGTRLPPEEFSLSPVIASKGQRINLGDFQGAYNGFVAAGDYEASIFSIDERGNPSPPRRVLVRKTAGPDVFEDDDTAIAATPTFLSAEPQRHTLHQAGDQDWLLVSLAPAAEPLQFQFEDVDAGLTIDVKLYDITRLIDTDAVILASQQIAGGNLIFPLPNSLAAGGYLLQITQADLDNGQQEDPSPGYSVGLAAPVGVNPGKVVGKVLDLDTMEPISFVVVQALDGGNEVASTFSSVGDFELSPTRGTYDLKFISAGYQSLTINNIAVEPNAITPMSPNPVLLSPVATSILSPQLTLDDPGVVGETSIALRGQINANGIQTSANFLFGADSGQLIPLTRNFNISGSTVQGVGSSVSHLSCDTEYFFALTATNAGGTETTSTQSATTAECGSLELIFENGFEL